MYVILVYDIAMDEDGANAWRRIYSISKEYLHHVQKCLIEGELTESGIVKLRAELKQWIRDDLDSVLLFKSSGSRWLKKEVWGKEDKATSNFL